MRADRGHKFTGLVVPLQVSVRCLSLYGLVDGTSTNLQMTGIEK
jgi:hypothetical protein